MSKDMRENLALILGERLQHKVGGVLATGWAADADAHTSEVGAAAGSDDVAQTVVAAVTATVFDTQDVEIQI